MVQQIYTLMAEQQIRILVSSIKKPIKNELNPEIQSFSDCLGLFSMRDKEKSCFRVFIEILKSAKKKKALSSDEIAFKTGLSRGTVVHHLNRLIVSGIVIHKDNKYILRDSTLAGLVDGLQKDIEGTFHELKVLAKCIDEGLK